MKSWEAPIPKPKKFKDRKRCFCVWEFFSSWSKFKLGGKIVWLTEKQITFFKIKYPNIILEEVIEKDKLEMYKKYMDQTID